MEKVYRWGILGAGNIAHRFARSLKSEKRSVLYAIAGRNREKLERFQQEFPCEVIYDDYDAFLNDENIDVVYLALPHGLHCPWAVKTLKKGKAVLCEKPATVSAAEMAEIERVHQETGVFFMEAMKGRFTPAYRQLKKDIGTIGEIIRLDTSISFKVDLNTARKEYMFDPRQGGGLLDNGIYCASWYEDLIGERPQIAKTVIDRFNGGIDIYVRADLQFSRAGGTLESALDRAEPKNAVITGTKGEITVYDLHRPQRYRLRTVDRDEEVFVPYEVDDFYSQIAHVIDCLENGKKESDIMPLRASRYCAELLEAIRNH